jgi:hypothetical protein
MKTYLLSHKRVLHQILKNIILSKARKKRKFRRKTPRKYKGYLGLKRILLFNCFSLAFLVSEKIKIFSFCSDLIFFVQRKKFCNIFIDGNVENFRTTFKQAQKLCISGSRWEKLKKDFNIFICKMIGVEQYDLKVLLLLKLL